MASEERRKNTADGEGGASGSRSPTASARGFSPANKGKSSISDPDEGHEMWRKCEEGVSAIMHPCFLSDDIPRGLEELAAMHQKKTKDAASDKILDASALFQNDRREEKKMASEEMWKNTADGEGRASGSRSPTASARGFSPVNKGKSSISDPDEGHEMWRKCEEGVSEELAAMHWKKTKDAASDKILDASALFQNDQREEKKMASEERRNTADGESGADGFVSPTAIARGFSPANKAMFSVRRHTSRA